MGLTLSMCLSLGLGRLLRIPAHAPPAVQAHDEVAAAHVAHELCKAHSQPIAAHVHVCELPDHDVLGAVLLMHLGRKAQQRVKQHAFLAHSVASREDLFET